VCDSVPLNQISEAAYWLLNSKDILDKEVIGAGGWKLGKVKEIVVDTTSWQVTSLELDLEGDIKRDFNVKSHLVDGRFPLDPQQIQSIGDRIVLKSTKEELFRLVASPTT